MDRKTLAAFSAWGDRANRDTGHLMDIVVAGAIDQLIGHGTVILRPARLEEIVSRIAPRERERDGGWVVTLLPETLPHETFGGETEEVAVNTERTSAEVATIAARVLNMPEIEVAFDLPAYNALLRDAKRLAGSALTQRG